MTHDKKDFAGATEAAIDHAGIVLYTDAKFLHDRPEAAVWTLERAFDHYPASERRNEIL